MSGARFLMAWVPALCLLPAAAAAGGQASPPPDGGAREQRGNAGMNASQDRSANSPAEALYVEKCSMCHRQFGMGTVLLSRRMPPDQAVLENRTNLTPEFVAFAARQGIGNMPRITRGEVSDEQLAEIARYLGPGRD
jgi:cytochrome c553